MIPQNNSPIINQDGGDVTSFVMHFGMATKYALQNCCLHEVTVEITCLYIVCMAYDFESIIL